MKETKAKGQQCLHSTPLCQDPGKVSKMTKDKTRLVRDLHGHDFTFKLWLVVNDKAGTTGMPTNNVIQLEGGDCFQHAVQVQGELAVVSCRVTCRPSKGAHSGTEGTATAAIACRRVGPRRHSRSSSTATVASVVGMVLLLSGATKRHIPFFWFQCECVVD